MTEYVSEFHRIVSNLDFKKSCGIDRMVGFYATDDQRKKFQVLEEIFYKHVRKPPDEFGKDRIPKFIHQVWPGEPIPEKWMPFQRQVKKLHPDWTYKLWSDYREIEEPDDEFKMMLIKSDNYAMISDLIRVAALRKYGGVYLDFDCWVHKPFDNMILYFDFFAPLQIYSLLHNCVILNRKYRENRIGISNFLIGSTPKHPIIDEYLSLFKSAFFSYDENSEVIPMPFGERIMRGVEWIKKMHQTLRISFWTFEQAIMNQLEKIDSRVAVLPVTMANPVFSPSIALYDERMAFACLKYFLLTGKNGYKLHTGAGEETYTDHFASGNWAKGKKLK